MIVKKCCSGKPHVNEGLPLKGFWEKLMQFSLSIVFVIYDFFFFKMPEMQHRIGMRLT